jgi:hypothetical protein
LWLITRRKWHTREAVLEAIKTSGRPSE